MRSIIMDTANIDWYRTPVGREALKEFTQKSDLKGWLQAGSFLLIFVLTTAAAFYFFRTRQWVAMVVLCYFHSLFQGMVGMSAAVHELSHGTVFVNKSVNEFFYKLFCFLTWNNPVHFRASHMLHHQLTVHRGRDKEVIQVPVAEKLNWVNLLSWLTFDFKWCALLTRVNILHALGRGEVDYFSWDPLFPEGDPRRAAMCAWALLALTGYLVLTAVFIVFHLWVLIYLLVFGSFFVRILANLTGAIQHTGLSENVPDWRLVCHTVKVNPLLGYLYWHMNYHTEHHMYAAVPCFNLARFHRAVAGDMQDSQRSFTACLRLLYRIRKKQKQDPGYVYVPEFPATAAPPRWS